MNEQPLKIKYDRRIYDFAVYTDTDISYEKNHIAGFNQEKDAEEYINLKNQKDINILLLQNTIKELIEQNEKLKNELACRDFDSPPCGMGIHDW